MQKEPFLRSFILFLHVLSKFHLQTGGSLLIVVRIKLPTPNFFDAALFYFNFISIFYNHLIFT